MFSNECSTRSSRCTVRYLSTFVLCLLPLAFSSRVEPNVATADKVTELQSHFDRENHATSKVKILEKLGQAQFAAATSAQQAGNFNDIGLICEKFRDNVRTAFDLLKQQEPNAEKHPEGYRHLELQTRRGIREVEDLLIIVPQEVRPPIEIVRGDLIHFDDELIHLLFPSRAYPPDRPSPLPPAGGTP
jgi:hypothetical protein